MVVGDFSCGRGCLDGCRSGESFDGARQWGFLGMEGWSFGFVERRENETWGRVPSGSCIEFETLEGCPVQTTM